MKTAVEKAFGIYFKNLGKLKKGIKKRLVQPFFYMMTLIISSYP